MKLPSEVVGRLRPAYAGKSVCVTGGAGFIGGHLVDALLSLDASIVVLDDLSNSTLEHLAELIDIEPGRVRFVHGSVLDDDALRDAIVRGPGGAAAIIFHLAALGSVPRSIAEPQRTWSVNATGTARVLESARAAKSRRVVLAASSSAYGDTPMPVGGRSESAVPVSLSPYAASKVAAEQLMAAWASSYSLSTISLRYFNVFGPRQSADSAYAAAIPAMTRRILDGQPPLIFGDGRQSRDFTFVDNAVFATLLAGASERPLRGEVVNIGTGRSISVIEIAAAIATRCGVPDMSTSLQPARAGEVRESRADISRARELLGFEPLVSFEHGLDETVEWHKTATAER